MTGRKVILVDLAGEVRALPRARRLVAMDGSGGSGKTVLAAELAAVVRDDGRDLVEASVGFVGGWG